VKILLLNDNPVVNKLVTLSAQKTSDTLVVVTSIDEIEDDKYDLLVVDDTLYSDELFEELSSKIKYTKSLYICSRDAQSVDAFDAILKKPFLPTDLVDLFVLIGNQTENSDSQEMDDELSLDDDLGDEISLDGDDELSLDDDLGDELSLDEDDELSLDDDLGDELSLDEDDELSLDDDLGDELSLDEDDELSLDDDLGDELSRDEDDELSLDDDLGDELSLDEDDEPEDNGSDELAIDIASMGVLDEEDLQEVQELFNDMDKTDSDDSDLVEEADELSLDDDETLEETDELSLDDDEMLEEANELSLDDGDILEEDEPIIEEENIEQQIEDAVSELSEEELESEVDEETLLNIVSGDMDSLTSRDLKMAIGEEVETIVPDEVTEDEPVPDEAEIEEPNEEEVISNENNDAVAKLQNLLEALNDKNVAASLKGMKISINITLGDD